MQAIRNKFHSKSKRSSMEKRRSIDEPVYSAESSSMPSSANGVVTSFNESHQDLPDGKHVDHYEKTEVIPGSSSDAMMIDASSSIPVPPPMPPAGYWMTSDTTMYDKYWIESSAPVVEVFPTESVHRMEMLPMEIVEKPVVIHESIRTEQVEEIQPVVRVEREKTEIRQITQPLTDKEIRPVMIQDRTLPVEVLPTIFGEGMIAPEQRDISTRDYDATLRQVIEKNPIVQETEKWRIIEEVQPVIYREIVIPHIIRTNRPMREVIVEAPMFTEQILQSREMSLIERERWSQFFNKETIIREVLPATTVPIMSSIPEPQLVRVAPLTGRKEIIEDVITTTVTTTTAPVVGSTSRGALSSSSSASTSTLSMPTVVDSHHDVKVGPHGEKITRDSVTTTSSSSVLPTRAL